ncbi:hypothetical protein HK099_007858 [Clydaea vesicula]|uniref:Uncharacterized protein n=1 Tax=Clydaea vesicula TaxID=447962 RepID=A0AAD5Y0G7_9FUNG|nr:hypothetical protein HK099_007858 [Clydaea vesicula]
MTIIDNIAEANLTDLLTKITCSELLYKHLSSTGHAKPQQPICLDSKLTVHEGCQTLAHIKISSPPVYDTAEGRLLVLDFLIV